MATDITNLSVFITGAGSGVGRAAALKFASSGSKLFLTGRTESKLIETKELVLAKYPKTEVNLATFDLTDKAALKEAVENAARIQGGISIVVANAAVGGTIYESLEAWEALIDTNLTSILHLSTYVTPHLEESAKKHGIASIVFVSSVLGYVKLGVVAPYVASKHGLNGWSGSLFLHLQDKGIKVSTINPGFIDTPFLNDLPGGRPNAKVMLTPDHVAYAIHFAATFPEGGVPTDISLVPQYTTAALNA
jgi:short-subunit dehydrogenase